MLNSLAAAKRPLRAAVLACVLPFASLPATSGQVVKPPSSAASQPDQLYTFDHPAMGTTYTLYLFARSPDAAGREADRAFAIVDDVESLLSNYQPQSELSRINRLAADGPVTTDPETFGFLQRSLDWSRRSDGAFDISVGALMQAWGFFRSTGHIPDSSELAKVGLETGWQKVELDPSRRTVRFTAPGLQLDPGGIGKGFAVDLVAAALREDGVRAALLSAGSSTLYAIGAPPGDPGWRIDIPNPGVPETRSDAHSGPAISTVYLKDTSLSTANCSEKHFVLAGHLYCHIMDPRLLRPVEGRLQATVIAPSATDSDALSNVAFVGSDAERAAWMRQLAPGVRALVFDGTPVDAAAKVPPARPAPQACRSYRWLSAVNGGCTPMIGGESQANKGIKLKETR